MWGKKTEKQKQLAKVDREGRRLFMVESRLQTRLQSAHAKGDEPRKRELMAALRANRVNQKKISDEQDRLRSKK